MIPVLFGDAERVLAGVYSPVSGPAQRRGAVICPPFGQEHLRAHRTGRILSERLAARGVDVLRFDYFGTGESYGDSEQVSLEGAVDDARAAVRELLDLSGVRRVTLVGIRAGGLVAALAAKEERAVDRLALCDPILDGRAHIEELLSLADDKPGPNGNVLVRGFPLTDALRAQLSRHTPDIITDVRQRLLVLVSTNGSDAERLGALVRARGEGAAMARVDGDPYWSEAEGIRVGAVPSELIDRVAEWHG